MSAEHVGVAVSDRVELVSTEVARARLGIGRTKFYELLDAGLIRSVKIGRRRLVVAGSVDQFIDSLVSA